MRGLRAVIYIAYGVAIGTMAMTMGTFLIGCDDSDAESSTGGQDSDQVTAANDLELGFDPADIEKASSPVMKIINPWKASGLGYLDYASHDVDVPRRDLKAWWTRSEYVQQKGRITAVVTPTYGDPDLFIIARDEDDDFRLVRYANSYGGDQTYIDEADLHRGDAKVYFAVWGYTEARFDIDFYVPSENQSALSWPLPSSNHTYTHRFGEDWVANTSKRHTGVDINATTHTPVRAVAGGTVAGIGWLGESRITGEDWGYGVLVKHENDMWTSCYLHIGAPALDVGDPVSRGDYLGGVKRDHLHFGIWDGPFNRRLAIRGALPKENDGEDPVFPQHFVNPLDYEYE